MRKKAKKSGKKELIYVKFEYNELLEAKRDILGLEMQLLKIIKTLKQYHHLRIEELKKKEVLYKKFNQTSVKMRSLERILPKPKKPEILKHSHAGSKVEVKETKVVASDTGLEDQLQEIQNRLTELQR